MKGLLLSSVATLKLNSTSFYEEELKTKMSLYSSCKLICDVLKGLLNNPFNEIKTIDH